MEIFCSAIIWIMCIGGLPGDVEIDLTINGFDSIATIEGEEWQAVYNSGGDVVMPRLVPERLSRACLENYCQGYHRFCETTEQTATCRYIFTYDSAGMETGPFVSVTSGNEASLVAATQMLGIVFDRERQRAMPFAMFDEESTYRTPEEFYCAEGPFAATAEIEC